MMNCRRIVCWSAAFALLAGAAAAQGTGPARPDLARTGGSGRTAPGPTVYGLTANEFLASQLPTNVVVTRNRIPLGAIADALLDPKRGAVDLVVLRRASDGRQVVIPWSQLSPAAGDKEGFVTKLSKAAVAAAPAYPSAATRRSHDIDVMRDLIRRPVTGEHGKSAGSISDLVIRRKTGAVDFVLIDPGRLGIGGGHMQRALPWSAVATVPAQDSRPVKLAVDDAQVMQAPVFGLKAKARPQEPSAQATFRRSGH